MKNESIPQRAESQSENHATRAPLEPWRQHNIERISPTKTSRYFGHTFGPPCKKSNTFKLVRFWLIICSISKTSVIVFSGCNEENNRITPAEAPRHWSVCQNSEECKIIELGCCGPCSGVFSVNKIYMEEARSQMKEKNCEGVNCNSEFCSSIAICKNGLCQIKHP